MSRDGILVRLDASRAAVLAAAHRLSPSEIRDDIAWGWVYLTIHGHYLDHLGIIEPWTEALRDRQVDGDPFVEDPRAADQAEFRAQDAAIEADLQAILAAVPPERLTRDHVTPGWTVQDHLGHLADWAQEVRPRHRRLPPTTATGCPTPTRDSTPGTSGWPRRRAASRSPRRSSDTRARATPCWPRSTP